MPFPVLVGSFLTNSSDTRLNFVVEHSGSPQAGKPNHLECPLRATESAPEPSKPACLQSLRVNPFCRPTQEFAAAGDSEWRCGNSEGVASVSSASAFVEPETVEAAVSCVHFAWTGADDQWPGQLPESSELSAVRRLDARRHRSF